MTVREGTMTRSASLATAALGVCLAVAPVAATPGAALAAPAAAGGVTIAIDPSYQQPEWEGWGTSLVWMANQTGGYPDEIRDRLVDLLFGANGLNLNIARYNIGGGNAPTVRDYLRPGGAVPGFWKAPEQYGPTDKEWWDPENPEHWDFAADANQRWWVDQIKDRVTRWESFSNSPPYFQTVSGYVSGGFDAGAEQIRADKVDDFAEYLVRVTEHLETAHGIEFDTIDPLNEPNTNYWRTVLGSDGRPTGGRQEGAHAGPALQAQVIEALRRELDKTTTTTTAGVSAPDETNPSTFGTDWYGYPAAAQGAVDQLNVHTYGTGQRTAARDIAKAERRPLWMSEVEGSWGRDFTSMDSGLGMAQHIIDDIRDLEPSAWVLWQPIEDLDNMVDEGNLQWGSIHVPFDCTATDTLATCPVKTNTKFDTIRNFTHYLRPGDHMVKVNDTHSLAAVTSDGRAANVVHVNSGAEPKSVTLDLSKFGVVRPNATVTPVVTSATGKLVKGTGVKVADQRATLTVPARSVTTFLITGVASINPDAAHLQAGHTYRIEGVASGRSVTPAADNAIAIRTNDLSATDQLWKLRAVADRRSSLAQYAVINAGTGQRLAVRDGRAVLEDSGADDDAARWVVSTTGDGTYTFINAAARRVLDVSEASNADGAGIGLWLPSSAGNQRWTVKDETVERAETLAAHTVPNRAPALPATVTAVLHSGAQRSLPVEWKMPSRQEWRAPGTVTVRGVARDVFNRRIPATAEVTVDVFTATEPARAKVYAGGRPELPATVIGLGKHGGKANLPVTWEAAPAGAYDRVGVVALNGSATVVTGKTLPATVRVQVTAPAEVLIPHDSGLTISATFTETGYSAARLTNGDTTDKAWSNWKPSERNPSDSLTVRLPENRELTRVVTHFYRDNSSGGGLAQTIQAGVPDASGTCVPGGDPVPVGTSSPLAVSVPVPAAATDTVCLVLTAVPNGYLTVAELEVFAKGAGNGAGNDATLAGIQVDGVPIAGFDPATTSYRVASARPARAVVTATAVDPYATVVVTRDERVWTVTSTSEDGSAQATYRVEVVQGFNGVRGQRI